MFSRMCTVILLLVPCSLSAQQDKARSPVADTPELKVLDYWIGDWDIEITSAASTGEIKLGGKSSAKWIAGGRYVQQRVTMRIAPRSPLVEIENVMGWDANEKKYRVWSFSSHDLPREFKSSWDADKKTMKSVADIAPGITVTTTANFANAGKEQWKIVIASTEQGKLAEVTGVNTKK